jgi:arabinose-5-phosphate isomerase
MVVRSDAGEQPRRDDQAAEGLAAALRAMDLEAAAIIRTRDHVRHALPIAIDLIRSATGRVIVSGLGKSGHIGAKIAATLASTGTPAHFVHAGEALHGDAGMAAPGDVAILISYSGETVEVVHFGRILADESIPTIALTAWPESTLGRQSDVVLDIEVEQEADPLNLAPTASTAVTLALGDAIAAALMTMNGFAPEDFARRHPGGSLGARLATTPTHQGGRANPEEAR